VKIPHAQDYADQRYYTQTAGRFYTPDPAGHADLSNPNTWNQYVYANDDPVNFNDPTGLSRDWAGGDGGDDWGDDFPDIPSLGGGAHSIVLDWTAIARGNCDDGQWQTAFTGIPPCIFSQVAALAAAATAAQQQKQGPPPSCSLKLEYRPVAETGKIYNHSSLVLGIDSTTLTVTVQVVSVVTGGEKGRQCGSGGSVLRQ
jgi:RHS repeat-associated protein